MFTKSSFLVLLTVALSATSALAASNVGSKGAVSRRHHTPSKLSRSVAPSIKFSAKRSLRKKQEAKLARGLKAVNARGTNRLSRRVITSDDKTGRGGNGETLTEEDDTDTGRSNKGGKYGNTDPDEVYDSDYVGDTKKVPVDDEESHDKTTIIPEEDVKVYAGGDRTYDKSKVDDKVVENDGDEYDSDDDSDDDVIPSGGDTFVPEDNDDFGSKDNEDLETTQLEDPDDASFSDSEDEVSGGRGGDKSGGRDRVTQDEDEDRVTQDTNGDEDRVTQDTDGDEDRIPLGKGSRVTRADDSDFDKIARAEGIRRAPSGRWLGRRFK